MERDGKDFINQLSWKEENTTQVLVAKEAYHSTYYTPLGASPRPRRQGLDTSWQRPQGLNDTRLVNIYTTYTGALGFTFGKPGDT